MASGIPLVLGLTTRMQDPDASVVVGAHIYLRAAFCSTENTPSALDSDAFESRLRTVAVSQ